MEQCNQFKHLLETIKKYSDDVRLVEECLGIGSIKGYKFRLFQELNTNNSNGTDDKYCAYLCINDGSTKDGKWMAFYNEYEIDNWVKNK